MLEKFSLPLKNRTLSGVFYRPDAEEFPVVIFSHGYNGYFTDFTQMCAFLAESGVGACCFNFCGGSVRDTSGLSTADMTIFTETEDLKAVIRYCKEQKGTERIILFGASQGGLVSAICAEECGEELSAMALLFPALCIPDDCRGRALPDNTYPEEFPLWGMTLGRNFFETLRDFYVAERLGKFAKPVLIFHGDLDPVVPISYSERAADRYPNAQLKVFKGEGHGFSEAGFREVGHMLLELLRRMK